MEKKPGGLFRDGRKPVIGQPLPESANPAAGRKSAAGASASAKAAKITVTGTHNRTGQSETTIHQTEGLYIRQGDTHIVEYEEAMDSDAESGIVTWNRVRMDAREMEIERRGSVESTLLFASGREHVSDYKTPFGNMKMHIRTGRYSLNSLEKGKRLIGEAEYTVILNGMEMSETTIRIDVRTI